MTQIQTELAELLGMVEDAKILIIEMEPMRAQARIELDSKDNISDEMSNLYHTQLNQISDKLHDASRQSDLIHILSLQESTPGWPASIEICKGGPKADEGIVLEAHGGGGKTGWPP